MCNIGSMRTLVAVEVTLCAEESVKRSRHDDGGWCEKTKEDLLRVWASPNMMYNLGINRDGESREQPASPGSAAKMAIKTACVFFCSCVIAVLS